MAASKPIAPSSGHAESYVNPSKGIRFLPIAKAGLNHLNPGSWDDYASTLDPLTLQSMNAVMTPAVYLQLHYDAHTFGQLTRSVDQRWQNTHHLVMNTKGDVCPAGTHDMRKLLHFGVSQKLKEFVATVNLNTFNGDCGRLDNLKGARFMFCRRTGAATGEGRAITGFVPYFLTPFEDKDGSLTQIYTYITAENKLTFLQCGDSQHDDALLRIKATCALKKFDKMCAWCGTLRGDGTGDKLKKCPCKICRYCSKRCQLEHLPFHRGVCTVGGAKAE
jgi:hypothetical protein